MFNRTKWAAGCLTLVALTMVGCTGASPRISDTAYVTLDRPAQLPGLTLGAGTYVFEQANAAGPGSNVIRVRSEDRTEICFLAITEAVDRPNDIASDSAVSFTAADGAVRITAWYPKNKSVGHQFDYDAPPQPRVQARGEGPLSCGAIPAPKGGVVRVAHGN